MIKEEAIRKYADNLKNDCPQLTQLALQKYIEDLTVTELKKGEIHIKSGTIQQQGGFLVSGMIRAYSIDEDGNDQTISFISENDYSVHYESFVSQQPSLLSYECLEHCTMVNFSYDHFNSIHQRFPIFQKYLRVILERKLKAQRERLEGHLYLDAEQRYLKFINQYPDLFQRIQITHLCSYLGIRRQSLTRIRKKLSRK